MKLPPSAVPRLCARMRAMMSVGPAAANGTMILTGRSGYAAAFAGATPKVGIGADVAAAPAARLAAFKIWRREGRALLLLGNIPWGNAFSRDVSRRFFPSHHSLRGNSRP